MRLKTNAASLLALPLASLFLASTMGSFTAWSDESVGSSALSIGDFNVPSYRPKWTAQWKGELGGTTYTEGRDEGAAAFFHFDTRFEYPLLKWLDVMIEPRVDVYSSRLQERFDSDEYRNKIRANNLYISARPNPYFEARAGALSQDVVSNEILISRHRAFPGLQERVMLPLGRVKIQASAQQMVPTSYTLNTEREGKEALPTFQTQSLDVLGESQYGQLSALVGHFNFNQLPDKVASDSAILGNTSNNSETTVGSRFKYGFDGVFAGARLCLCNIGAVGLDMGYLYQRNLRAPDTFNAGQEWDIGPIFHMGDRTLSLKYINFFIESDATVANYLPGDFDGTNRVGNVIEAKYALEDHHWAVKTQLVNARTIIENDHQFTFTEFWVRVETEYAPF